MQEAVIDVCLAPVACEAEHAAASEVVEDVDARRVVEAGLRVAHWITTATDAELLQGLNDELVLRGLVDVLVGREEGK